MEREELEKLLTAVKVMPLRPTDRIVLRLKESLTDQQRDGVAKVAETIFPGYAVVVLDGDADVDIIREELPPGLLNGRLVEVGEGIVKFDNVHMSSTFLESLTRSTAPHRWFRITRNENEMATVYSNSVDAMVDKFLAWQLPKDFAPDCGISFDGRAPDQFNPSGKGWPVGTNLLTAVQAREMILHLLGSDL